MVTVNVRGNGGNDRAVIMVIDNKEREMRNVNKDTLKWIPIWADLL